MAALPTSYLAGNIVRLRFRTRDDAGALQDPTEITCKYGLEGEEGTALSVTRTAKGDYRADWDTTGLAGIYWIVARSTGALLSAREIRILVRDDHLD